MYERVGFGWGAVSCAFRDLNHRRSERPPMPWIIEYDCVLEQMRQHGLKCNYHNSGAFAFPEPKDVRTLGWVGPPDETIRPQVRPLTRQVGEPYEENLARLCTGVWQTNFPGRVWAMPMSHWSYELNYGSRDWMPALIENVELDPGLLEGRNNAAAIEFSAEEGPLLQHFVQRLLEMLLGSDFMLAFVGRPVLCTVHHHKQLWWQTTEGGVLAALEGAVKDQPQAT